jgi:YbbR domain-containing protein
LKRVVTELPIQLKKVTEEHKYTVTMAPVEGAVLVSDGAITVKISLTSPLLREPGTLAVYTSCTNFRSSLFDRFRVTSFTVEAQTFFVTIFVGLILPSVFF